MNKLEVVKYPDKKRYALSYWDTETNIHYTLAYFTSDENAYKFLEVFKEHIEWVVEGVKKGIVLL